MDEAHKIERIRIIQDRIRCPELFSRIISAEAAAELIRDGARQDLNVAVIEAVGIDRDGNLLLDPGAKNSAKLVEGADKVIAELNVVRIADDVGTFAVLCGPGKIAAVVITDRQKTAVKTKKCCN
jgi:acyl-CoA hydrolase